MPHHIPSPRWVDINWWTGESLLVLAGPIVVLPTAWIAWRMIRKPYG